MMKKESATDSLIRSQRNYQNNAGLKGANTLSPSASGAYIEALQKETFEEINPLVTRYVKLTKRLDAVENKLEAFKFPEHLNDYATYCASRGDNPVSELKKLKRQLERDKIALQTKIAEVRNKIDRKGISLSRWLNPTTEKVPVPASLVPTRIVGRDPIIVQRDAFICTSRQLPTRNICQKLDLEYARPGEVAIGLPESWLQNFNVTSFVKAYDDNRCKPLVQKLISAAKKR